MIDVFEHIAASNIYVSQNCFGDGSSAAAPIDINKAITSENVIPGDTLLFLDGTYTAIEKGVSGSDAAGKGVYEIKLNGDADNQVTIKPLNKNGVRINGGVEIKQGEASYITLEGFEISPTATTRVFATQADVDYPHPLYLTAPGCIIRDNHFHDGQDIAIFGTGGFVFENNIVGHQGWYTNDLAQNRDYCIYTHNDTYGVCEIKNNVFYEPFNVWALCMWSATGNNVWGYRATNNVMINGGIIVATDQGILQDNEVNDNILFNNSDFNKHFAMNYYGTAGDLDFTALRNYIVLKSGSMMIKNSLLPTFKNNTVVLPDGADWIGVVYHPEVGATPDIDNNTYYNESESFPMFGIQDESYHSYNTIEDWQTATGFDLNSTYTKGSLPADSVVIKAMSATRWSVSVFNWTEQNSVAVDMSAYVTDPCVVRNLLDYKDDSFNWDGTGNLVLDMVNRTHAEPQAYDTPQALPPTSFPVFGCFIVELV